MRKPAVFFDRDNTLIVSDGYLGDPERVVLVNGAADAVARARAMRLAVVIVSNQSGVARGLFDEDAVQAVNGRLEQLLAEQNPQAIIDRHEYCPFHPDGTVEHYRQESHLRKPSPGMLYAAADTLGLDLARSWVVGDAPRDIIAGKAAGCRTILFRDPALRQSPAASETSSISPDYTAASLMEAMDIIAREAEPAPAPSSSASGDEQGTEPNPWEATSGGNGAGGGEDGGEAVSGAGGVALVKSAEQVLAGGRTGATGVNTAGLEESIVVPASRGGFMPAPVAPGAATAPVAALRGCGETRPSPAGPVVEPASLKRLENLAEQLLVELRRRAEQPRSDFSVSKLLAGMVQVIVVAVLFISYFSRSDPAMLTPLLILAATFQAMTIALLIMGHQR